ncbi:MAG: hypothetical protein ACI81L_000107 [Verrucomicrobiales bacterium]|jgi:hypothetical protein
MKQPKWAAAGASTPTTIGTFLSFMAALIGGLGVLVLAFGQWLPGTLFLAMGATMWLTGRWLISR